MIGTLLANRYQITRVLGEGGMAIVYYAEDLINKRPVAIKIIKKTIEDFEMNKQRFDREARTIAYLMHPNIIEIYAVGENDDGLPYIVMEYIDSTSLKDILKKRCNLTVKEAVDFMLQLTLAVQHAHFNGVLHRDIKPQNILIRVDNVVKLGDFGIAIFENAPQLTRNDEVMGTVHYLAPEVLQGDKASVQSDIYQLGITFFEMLVGQMPFDGSDVRSISLKHINDKLPSLRKYNRDVPVAIEKIIKKACQKEKYARYPSAKAMHEDILKVLQQPTQKKRGFLWFLKRN